MAQIYGIDLASEKFDVSYPDEKGKKKHKVVKNERAAIEKFLSTLPEDAWIVAEHTGAYGDLLLFLADLHGIRISYVNGYEIKHSAGLTKGKSDKADSAMIRDYGERHIDRLVLTHFPSETMYRLRQAYTARRLLVKQRKELETTLHVDARSPLENDRLASVKNQVLAELNAAIKEVEDEMERLIQSDEELARSAAIARSVPGIGMVTSTEIIIKTGNFKRVSTAKKCASLAGIAPFPNATGKTDKGNHVAAMGDKQLKSLLFMCAMSSVTNSDRMRVYKMKKMDVERKHFFLVMNNIANKLLKTLYALVKKGEMFNSNYLPRDPRLKTAGIN